MTHVTSVLSVLLGEDGAFRRWESVFSTDSTPNAYVELLRDSQRLLAGKVVDVMFLCNPDHIGQYVQEVKEPKGDECYYSLQETNRHTQSRLLLIRRSFPGKLRIELRTKDSSNKALAHLPDQYYVIVSDNAPSI